MACYRAEFRHQRIAGKIHALVTGSHVISHANMLVNLLYFFGPFWREMKTFTNMGEMRYVIILSCVPTPHGEWQNQYCTAELISNHATRYICAYNIPNAMSLRLALIISDIVITYDVTKMCVKTCHRAGLRRPRCPRAQFFEYQLQMPGE